MTELAIEVVASDAMPTAALREVRDLCSEAYREEFASYLDAIIRTVDGLQPTPGESVMILRLPRTPGDLDRDAALNAEWRRGELW
jgi:hypothetical protein